jgi:hypothetical protein
MMANVVVATSQNCDIIYYGTMGAAAKSAKIQSGNQSSSHCNNKCIITGSSISGCNNSLITALNSLCLFYFFIGIDAQPDGKIEFYGI